MDVKEKFWLKDNPWEHKVDFIFFSNFAWSLEKVCQESFPLSVFLHKKYLDFKTLATAKGRLVIPVLQALMLHFLIWMNWDN